MQEADHLCALARTHPWANPLLDALLSPQPSADFNHHVQALEVSLRRYPYVQAMLATLGRLGSYLQSAGLAGAYQSIKAGQSIHSWAKHLLESLDGLPALVHLDHDRRERKGLVKEVLQALEEYEQRRANDGKLPSPENTLDPERYGRWWAALVNCSAVTAWQTRCHEESPELIRLTPEVHANKVTWLESLLRQKRTLEPEAIRQRWLIRQQAFRNEAWNRMFQERNSRLGSGKRLREAIELSWDKGLPVLRPCWLVNPSAVSQLFPLFPGLFDLVIFDEASQCLIEQAIPAIFRGKKLVVTGDENQLPPMTFFSAGLEIEDEDTEEAEVDETPADVNQRRKRRAEEEYLMQATDLLEGAIGKLKQLYLSVHYRSDHPALIAFSNWAFYRGQLEAPPAHKDSVEGFRPIEYHAVNDTYRREGSQDVGFFVKNLENIQGDERDVMIFSTTFGPDPEGRFARRFGPVGMEGGHRRLNVAITRAKQQIFLVSSMPIPQIASALGGSASERLTPAGYLQLYLAYAQAVSAGDVSTSQVILDRLGRALANNRQSHPTETALEADLCSVLDGMGYKYQRGIGEAGFRIDLGVLHPTRGRAFILGIECDGGGWIAGRSARIREVWRPKLLRQRGWKLYRLSSAAWWNNRDREIKCLREAIVHALT